MLNGRWCAMLILCGLGAGAMPLTGCATMEKTRSSSVQMDMPPTAPPMTHQQLQQALMAFADRFVTRMEQATDELAQDTTDPELRQRAMATKYYPALAAITIAVEPDPEAALLDMVAMVTLERAVWRAGWAEEAFGDHAPRLLMAHDQLEQDIWSVAAKVLSDEQQKLLRELIEKFLRDHPEQRYVSNTRFDNFTALRDRALQRPSALIKLNLVVSGADEAAQAVVDARLFAERAMFLSARMPMLLSWQTQLLLYELALAPEVRQGLDNATRMTAAVQQLSSDLSQLPQRTTEQIDRTLSMIDQRHEKMAAIVSEMRAGVNDAQELTKRLSDVAAETAKAAAALDQAVQSTDRLIARFQSHAAAPGQPGLPGEPPARPFDIKEYTQAIRELATTAKELNSLCQQTDTLFATPALQQRLGDLDAAAAKRLEQFDTQAHGWVDALFTRIIWLIVIGSGAALVTGLVFRTLSRRWHS